jgi:hypothetical protein
MSNARDGGDAAVVDQPVVRSATDFLIAHGGPFYELQARLHLLHRHNLAAGRRAVLFAAIAWLPLALLSLIGGTALGDFEQRPFLLDFGAYARFILAVAIFVLMEPMAERRLRRLTSQFVESGLILPAQLPAAAAALLKAVRLRDSRIAEIVVLLVAYAISYWIVMTDLAMEPTSWLATMQDGAAHLSLAGWWCLLVSLPIFLFLLARWIWRFIVWSLLLRDLAKLDLQLVATHPDGAGGLGFISQYPPVFTALVFALSCVVAAKVAKVILHAGIDFHVFMTVIVGWLVLTILCFAMPLTAFVPSLSRLKKQALLEYGALSSRHNRAFQRRWLHSGEKDEDLLGAADISSLADLATGYEAVRRISPLPLAKESVLPLAVAVLVPMLGVAATQLPIREVLQFVSRLLV